MVMMLRQCCCGCSLKTGAIILGVLNAIGGVANLATGISAAAASDFAEEESKNVFIGIGVTLAVLGGIMLLVAICLIIGAQKDNPVLLVPWMVYTLIFLVANTILYIVNSTEYFSVGLIANGTLQIIGAIVYILLEIYFLLVVYSLYRELKGTAPPNHA